MNEIGSPYNSDNPLYTRINLGNPPESQAIRDSDKDTPIVRTKVGEPTIEELIARDPKLKAAFENLIALASDPGTSDKDVFSLQRLIASLIDLGQALQQAATVYADRLGKVTEKMNAYAKMMGQIPVITKDQINFEKLGSDEQARAQTLGTLNNKYGGMLDTIRANKGIQEDKAKKIQTIMQTMKDAGQSANDFIGTFIDLFRGISQKIMK